MPTWLPETDLTFNKQWYPCRKWQSSKNFFVYNVVIYLFIYLGANKVKNNFTDVNVVCIDY